MEGWFRIQVVKQEADEERWSNTIMSLSVEVAGFGLCQTISPYSILVISVQQESFQAWTVYRRYSSFISLTEQLQILHPSVPHVPRFDPDDLTIANLSSCRCAVDKWWVVPRKILLNQNDGSNGDVFLAFILILISTNLVQASTDCIWPSDSSNTINVSVPMCWCQHASTFSWDPLEEQVWRSIISFSFSCNPDWSETLTARHKMKHLFCYHCNLDASVMSFCVFVMSLLQFIYFANVCHHDFANCHSYC